MCRDLTCRKRVESVERNISPRATLRTLREAFIDDRWSALVKRFETQRPEDEECVVCSCVEGRRCKNMCCTRRGGITRVKCNLKW